MKFVQSLVFLVYLATPVGGADPSRAADYPCWRGPTGSGGIEGSGFELIDSAKDARLLWISEEKNIGYGWGPTDSAHNQGNSNVRSSGYGGMVVADGRGYFITYEPSGAVADDEMVARSKDRRESSWKINADDVLFCLDMKTGRTLWKTVFSEKGLNLNWYREGTFTYPCVAEGKVFFTGTAGRMYALDAVTGKPLWESTVGQGAELAEAWRRDCLQLVNGRLSGEIKFQGPVTGAVTVDAQVKDAVLLGTFRGKQAEAEVAGLVEGELDFQSPAEDPATVYIRLANVLKAGTAAQNDLLLKLVFKTANAAEVEAACLADGAAVAVKVEKPTLQLTKTKMTGSLTLVADGKTIAGGTHTLSISSHWGTIGTTGGVGSGMIMSEHNMTLDGQPVAKGSFMAFVRNGWRLSGATPAK